MTDAIMVAGAVVFWVLFTFLLFVFGVFIASLARQERAGGRYRPRVSVLVPAHNEETRIAACLAALRATRYQRLELIVIDDGSSDATARVAAAMGAHVLRQRHLGKPAALNRGLAAARGSIILTVDADTTVAPDYLRRIVQPFRDPRVGATSGAVLVANDRGVAGMFQRIEYQYNNLIRRSFSRVFRNGIWFFGCLGAYRASVLRRIGGFPADTMAEDMDVAMAIRAAGYLTLNVPDASGRTIVPTTLRGLFLQRSRWWIGGLQSLIKHRRVYRSDRNPSLVFLAVNHAWWAAYAFLSLPLIMYQVAYWYPDSGATLYLVRWFTLWGPLYVLYKIPEWGVSALNIFGVLSGVLSVAMILAALRRVTLRDAAAIILYFPYTIILNLIVAGSVVRALVTRQRTFRA